jgi:hypothetical protein
LCATIFFEAVLFCPLLPTTHEYNIHPPYGPALLACSRNVECIELLSAWRQPRMTAFLVTPPPCRSNHSGTCQACIRYTSWISMQHSFKSVV